MMMVITMGPRLGKNSHIDPGFFVNVPNPGSIASHDAKNVDRGTDTGVHSALSPVSFWFYADGGCIQNING